MATHNVVITYPDGQQARILTALKAAAANEDTPAPTNAQALEWFANTVRASMRDVVLRYERELAVKAAADAVLSPDVS